MYMYRAPVRMCECTICQLMRTTTPGLPLIAEQRHGRVADGHPPAPAPGGSRRTFRGEHGAGSGCE